MTNSFKFQHSNAHVHNETHNGDIVIAVTPTLDADGNQIPIAYQEEMLLQMDNFQAHQLALSILRKVDVVDTRGSR